MQKDQYDTTPQAAIERAIETNRNNRAAYLGALQNADKEMTRLAALMEEYQIF